MPPGNSAGSGASPFAPTHAVDEKACRKIGARLGSSRGQRSWSHADVANRLLLSIAQVNGLERADASAFHNPAFFATALRKYAALMALDCPDAILVPKSPPIVRAEPGPDSADPPKSDGTASRFSVPKLWLAVATVVLLAGASALTVYFRGSTAPSTQPAATLRLPPPPAPIDRTEPPLPEPLPAPPVIALTEPPLPAPLRTPAPAAEPTPAPAALPAPSLPPPGGVGGAGLVTLARPAWVFVRYGDNSVTERVLQSGQSLTLRSTPIYLAIGAGEGVTLTLRGQPIDVSPFRSGDEIRIRASELAALAR